MENKVTRITVVDRDKGRIMEEWNVSNVELSYQDNGRTLKIFYSQS